MKKEKHTYNYRLVRIILTVFIISSVLCFSCKKEEDKRLKNYFSAGVINSQVISHNATYTKVRSKFFIWDKSNGDGIIPFDVSDRLYPSTYSYDGSFDSLRRVTTPYRGSFSAAVIISEGLDVAEGMDDFFEIAEPFTRKFLHTAAPGNEVMFAKAGNNKKPVEIYGNGFTDDGSVFDQELAAVCKNGNYQATDSLSLLKATDSVINYIVANSKYTNRHIVFVISRRTNFYQNVNMVTLMNKALSNGINCHLIDICPNYYWDNAAIYDFMKKLNARSSGIYYTSPYSYIYSYEDGELPMDFLQVAGKMRDIFTGGIDCFDLIMNVYISNSISGKVYTWDFEVELSTNYESERIRIPFNFYIN